MIFTDILDMPKPYLFLLNKISFGSVILELVYLFHFIYSPDMNEKKEIRMLFQLDLNSNECGSNQINESR